MNISTPLSLEQDELYQLYPDCELNSNKCISRNLCIKNNEFNDLKFEDNIHNKQEPTIATKENDNIELLTPYSSSYPSYSSYSNDTFLYESDCDHDDYTVDTFTYWLDGTLRFD